MKFSLNNRLDAKDECDKWLEAIIINVNSIFFYILYFIFFITFLKRSVKTRSNCILSVIVLNLIFGLIKIQVLIYFI